MKLANCECARVTDTLFCCHPVQLPGIELEMLYIGPRGVYAIVGEEMPCDPSAVRFFLRSLFGTSEIEIYLQGKGRYDFVREGTEGPLSEDALQTAIQEHTQERGFFLWGSDMLERLADRVRHEDARNRGVYRNSDGIWFIARGGHFVPLSDKDPNKILRLTLFGGIFGLHRFALGKWDSGILYLLTGGLIGLGWFMDLIQLALGAMKDRKKRLLPKPDGLAFPWYLAGFAASFVLFCLYAVSTGLFAGAMGQISQQMTGNIDPEQVSALLRLLQRISGQ